MISPLNYFLHAAGPAARPTMVLGWIFAAICMAVCIIITLLLAMAILRRRPARPNNEIIREKNGLRAVYAGTAISTVVLFIMMLYALVTLSDVATPTATPAFTITVTAYDWWWKVEYENAGAAQQFTTANEIHIPVGVPVAIKLKSADVIHAFWVPLLAGKTEMIPGLVNQQWLQADKPGSYYGKCTQFCGAQHAHMDFEVVAQTEKDFQSWQQAERQPAPEPNSAETKNGQSIFMRSCAGCHAVKGTPAEGNHAPDLTHLGSRRLIAAGMLSNTPAHVMDWVAHAQEIKPGCQMPDIDLSAQDTEALSAYLTTLH